MTKESVARQFFMDFVENLGEDYEYDCECAQDCGEEATLILADLFFSGLLEIKWDFENQQIVSSAVCKHFWCVLDARAPERC